MEKWWWNTNGAALQTSNVISPRRKELLKGRRWDTETPQVGQTEVHELSEMGNESFCMEQTWVTADLLLKWDRICPAAESWLNAAFICVGEEKRGSFPSTASGWWCQVVLGWVPSGPSGPVRVINNLRPGQSWEKDGSRILWAGLTKIKGTMNSRTSKKEFIKTPGQRVKEICICFVY